jgi:deazaflavin-dependent oxidoreductase (nitroreductase family)
MDYEAFERQLKADIRANGRPTSGFFNGQRLLILTTRGAKSGMDREALVNYSQDGERLVIVASKSGAPTNPDWYHNLVANPEATVEGEKETFRVRATEVKGAERDRLYEQHAAEHPQFKEYPSKTDRVIPVFVLERIGS